MAITFNTATTNLSSADGTSKTFSHTSDGKPLIVRVSLIGGATGVTVTYNGVSVPVKKENTYSTYYYAGLFYLATPASGANNVVVSWTTSCGSAISAQNIAGADAPVNEVAAGGNNTTPSVNVTSNASSLVVDCVMWRSNAGGTMTVGAGQTENFANVINTGGQYTRHGGSYETGAATTTMSWTVSSTNEWSIVAVSFPVTAVANTSNFFFMF